MSEHREVWSGTFFATPAVAIVAAAVVLAELNKDFHIKLRSDGAQIDVRADENVHDVLDNAIGEDAVSIDAPAS